MSITIEKMTVADKAEIIEMMREFYSSPVVLSNGSREIFAADVDECVSDSPYAEGYVFKTERGTAGYAMIAKSYCTEFGKRCVWIEDIFIRSEYRGAGIGKAFFEMLFAAYPNVVFRLDVETDNAAAMRLYEKCGFEILPYTEMIRK